MPAHLEDTVSTFKLDTDLAKRIAELASDLHAAIELFRDEWANRSERWQESDAGMEVDTWIEDLERIADDLDAVDDKPGS